MPFLGRLKSVQCWFLLGGIMSSVSSHPTWRSRWVFIMAAAGSAVGLGNLWKFPYILGENGGAAFLVLYLFCIVLVGIPVMMAEILIGRRARSNPIAAVTRLANESQLSKHWSLMGIMGVFTGLLILSFYSVIAGWSLHYISVAVQGGFTSISPDESGKVFGAMLASKGTLIGWHSVFMLISLLVVGFGVEKGLGNAVKVLMPLLFFMLIGLLIYSFFEGNFHASMAFLFEFDISELTWNSVGVAFGHAFFTLSLGMGAIMAYGAYLPEKAPIGRVVLSVAIIDTLVALVAGIVIFSIVFAHEGLSASDGPGLLFQSLPVAFGGMPGSTVIATVFFVLVAIAALSSAISLMEPAVAWLNESFNVPRWGGVLGFSALAWALGLGTVLSFNDWSKYTLYDKTFFDWLDLITTNILLPLGGLAIAIFVGWRMKEAYVKDSLNQDNPVLINLIWLILRYVSPVILLGIFTLLIANVVGFDLIALMTKD